MSEVAAVYDAIGPHFSRTRQKTYGNGASSNWPITDTYLKRLKGGDSVLDLGCGNGKLITGLPPNIRYVGSDFSTTLLNEAKKLHPGYEFRLGNVTELSHWEKLPQFEAIFAVALFHHIPPEKQLFVLKMMKRHLKAEGFIYLTVWNLWQAKFAQYRIEDHFEVPFNNKWKRYCTPYDIASLSELAMKAELVIEDIFYADRAGKKCGMPEGENLVLVAQS